MIVPPSEASPRRQQRWFKTKEQADAFARRVNDERMGRIDELYRLDRTSQALLVAALGKAGSAQAVLDAVNSVGQPIRQKSLREAIDALIQDRLDSGRSGVYVDQLQWTMNSFAKGRSDVPISSITTQDVRDWLKDRGGSADVRRAYITRIRGLFSFAMQSGNRWVRENPAKSISMPERSTAEPHILLPPQIKAVLVAASNHENKGMVTYFALLFFAGMRPSEVRRLKPENIRPEGIRVTAEVARKKKEARTIPMNDALKAFLDTGAPLPIPANWRKHFREIVKASGVQWNQDCARHSFVTYHSELFGWEETVKVAGHSLAMMLEHYRALTDKQTAHSFWSLRPDSI